MKSNKHSARKENVISIVVALFFILGFLSLISLDNSTIGYITLEELGIRNSSIENTTVDELGNIILIENISENSVESVGNLTFGINDSNLWGENENNLQFKIQGAGDQTVNLQYPVNNTNTSMRYINFTYNVSDADNAIYNCSLYLNIDGIGYINVTTKLGDTWTNQSDGFSASALGSDAPDDITTNGSDFWILDYAESFIYHTDRNGNNLSDGFSTLPIGAGSLSGITTNGSDFWIVDFYDDFIYHTDLLGNNKTDGFKKSIIGSADQASITTNGSDFWIADLWDDWVYHTDRNGNNLSDGFSTLTIGGFHSISSITTNGSDFWIVDYIDKFIYHTDRNGNNQTDGISTSVYGGINHPYGTTIFLSGGLGYNAGMPTEFYIADDGDVFIYHITKQITEIINQSINKTFDSSNHSIYWKVGCYADDSTQVNSSEYYLYIDPVAPAINLQFPTNNTNSSSAYINFTYNATDTGLGISSCYLYINNGTWYINSTDYSVTESINQTFNLTMEDSSILWKIGCNDTLNNKANSTEYNLTIDATAPAVNLQYPANNTNSTISGINFTYNTTDTTSDISSCYLYLNGIINSTDYSVTESINQTFNLTIEDSSILWKIGCNDTLNNKANSTAYNLTIDTTPPTINLQYPANNTNSTISGINFTYNVSDATSNIQNCSLLLNIDNTGYINITTDTEIEETINQSINKTFDQTNHSVYWKVSCYDTLNNNGNSSEYYLNLITEVVEQPYTGIISNPQPPALQPPTLPPPQPPAPPTHQPEQEIPREIENMNLDPGFAGILKNILSSIIFDSRERKISFEILNKTLLVMIENETRIDINLSEKKTPIIIQLSTAKGIRPEIPLYQGLFLILIILLLILFAYLIIRYFKSHKQVIKLQLLPGLEIVSIYEVNKAIVEINKLYNLINLDITKHDIESACRHYERLLSLYKILVLKLNREDQVKLYALVNKVYESLTTTIKIYNLKKQLNKK